ncbi:MAG: cation:proton antiporter [Cyclobacteriaceae bacterium]
MHVFDIIALLIFLSGLFIFVNVFFLKLPSSIGLMILALVLSFGVLVVGSLFPELQLAKHVKAYDFGEILYQFVLSVMLFAGALNVDFRKLGKQLIPVMVLAVFGVFISMFVIGTLLYFMLDLLSIQLTYLECLIFGALISSTDPIAVTKTIRRFELSEKLETKISGESLLNAGVGVILALSLYHLHTEFGGLADASFMEVSWLLIVDLVGGFLLGLGSGWVGYKVLKYVDNDHVHVEVLVTLALVMSASLLADVLGVSSKMVAMVSGLLIVNIKGDGDEAEEPTMGNYVRRFWQLLEETMAAMLFVLIGFEMLVIPLRLDYFAAGFFAVNIVIFARWVSVFIPIKLMSYSRSFDNNTISVLSWGALRGGLPVAVSLSLVSIPGKEIVVSLTYVVVVCSVIYQGLTVKDVMGLYQNRRSELG